MSAVLLETALRELRELRAQRDQARRFAVALEQEVAQQAAELEALTAACARLSAARP